MSCITIRRIFWNLYWFCVIRYDRFVLRRRHHCDSWPIGGISTDDQIIIAKMILNPAAAHDGLVDTLRAHAEDVEVK